MRSKTRNFRPFAKANGKENIRLSQSKNHIQTVIFSRETRWTNLPRISFSKPRKARIQMERKLFFQKNLNFLCGLADADKFCFFWEVWRLVDSGVLGILSRFGKRSETA